MMEWHLSHQSDPMMLALADRHYSRQKPGTNKAAPPGRKLVLVTADGLATWISCWPFAEFVHRVYPDAWICTLFHREGGAPASELITQAVAATRWYWGTPPPSGMITLIDAKKVRPIKRRGVPVWGWTYRRAGWQEVGKTVKRKFIILQLCPVGMPPAEAPFGPLGTLLAGLPALHPTNLGVPA